MTDTFDIQAIEDSLVAAAGTALVQPELYWVGDEEGQISAFDDTGLRNTIFIHKDTQTRDSTIAYTDPTKNVKQYTLDMPVRVIPCYDTVRGKRIEWQIIGADVKLATIRPDSDPSIGSGGNVIQHSHQNTDEGGQLDATYVFNGGKVPAEYGGTNNDFIANPPADGALFLWNASQYRIEPAYFNEGGILIGEQAAQPTTFEVTNEGDSIRGEFDGVDLLYRWTKVRNTYDATVNPTAADDETEGYKVGSVWYNTENETLWFCKSASGGGAIWAIWTLGLGKNIVTSGAPTTGDDETLGYQVNSLWFDTDDSAVYVCWDATEAAAVWTAIGGAGGVQNNWVAFANPTEFDDETEGYSAGSLWYNTVDLRLWMCATAAEDDAWWYEIGAYGQVATKAINTVTGTTYNVDITNYFMKLNAASNNITVNLPPAADVRGREFVFKRIDSTGNTVTLDGDGAETIDGATTYTLSAQYDAVRLFSDGTEYWVIGTA